ncbi:hypothetical protein BOSEA31B_20325 [Hyphomicrobiales bacterium]|jgi:hypothetical protein|nr:hypothetical protein BOSEA31B_20325 [Hyphomicrobiales bacterium]CAH1702300.1 hypothetical protein BOSEA1005_30172 [Hyphomicrobiales bacterium]CAI0346501.1 hypothetical protein BO1005MUT1_520013 [Hyphomicrobiales bacterium]
MEPTESTVEQLDFEYVYAGTPPDLRASGPYEIEAFFKFDSLNDVVAGATCWLEARRIQHEMRIETNLEEEGFFLRISFPLEESRMIFVREYCPRDDEQ